jgi:hypothetical protein
MPKYSNFLIKLTNLFENFNILNFDNFLLSTGTFYCSNYKKNLFEINQTSSQHIWTSTFYILPMKQKRSRCVALQSFIE